MHHAYRTLHCSNKVIVSIKNKNKIEFGGVYPKFKKTWLWTRNCLEFGRIFFDDITYIVSNKYCSDDLLLNMVNK